jgi:Ca2+/Na+ antiporter
LDWTLLVSDVVFTLAAAILSLIGLSTLKAIRHLGIGRSFWAPVSMSGILFLLGSVVRLLHEFVAELDPSLIVSVSWLLALCSLVISIYNYSRKAKTEAHTHYYEMDSNSQPRLITHLPKPESKKRPVKQKNRRGVPMCPHHLGYLAEIPKDASIPEECMTCTQMLACKNVSILRAR